MERAVDLWGEAGRLVRPQPASGVLAVALLLSGCGGGGSSYSPPATYSIGGTITGLTAAGLTLANGSDTASPAAGATSFAFATALSSGSSYAVTVKTQPKTGMCQIADGSGQVGSAAVTNVLVTCTRTWSWLSGSSTVNATGVYRPPPGGGGSSTVPGARNGSFSWIDSAGDLWLFAGTGFDNQLAGTQALLNDLWRYSADAGKWTWVSGSSTALAKGVYGTLGMAAANNVPGARTSGDSWTDSAGVLWLFGGFGIDSTGASGDLNDLWRYSPGTGQWTWVSGSSTVSAQGVYGTQGMAAANNVPGARTSGDSWTDSAGVLWLFGGFGIDSTGASGDLNDLWRYSPGTGQWTWVSGSSTVNATGVYGTLGVAAPGNVPGARSGSVSWIDSAGDLWLLGGSQPNGRHPSGYPPQQGWLNDLWRYSPGTDQWTWVSGSSTGGAQGVYGTQGMAAAANVPGARLASISWTDSAGDLWLFGGVGLDSAGNSGDLNDLWVY
jgi:N-acetylneuraminic acid mutarotase